MRTTLLGSLLDAARRNLSRGASRLALFESARVYLQTTPPTGRKAEPESANRPVGPLAGDFVGERGAPFAEPHRVGALACGALEESSWRGDEQAADFFALKASLEALAGQLGALEALGFEEGAEPFAHPARTARVLVGAEPAGWIAEVHPLVCREWDLESAVAFEIDLAPLVGAARAENEVFEEVSTFPTVREDLAVIVPDELPAGSVVEAARRAAERYLHDVRLFDEYRGEQVGEGRKSLALRLEFRAPDRTLEDAEVGEQRGRIEAALAEIGGQFRE
jgi:phenylalanyl-tRNA synthetase beta chain